MSNPRNDATCEPDPVQPLWESDDKSLLEMARAARAFPQYSKTKVDAAGNSLIKLQFWENGYDEALVVINNWRSSHSFPLNTFHMGLRRRVARVDIHAVTSERIKRLSSIETKLQRFKSTRLSQMQDIGGCRATVETVRHVQRLVKSYEVSDLKHKLDHQDDYIGNPQASGYRGMHLIYRYFSDRKDTYNGLKIEVQIRSVLQHAWATAVETVGTFTRQALKSSKGEDQWLRFFALVGSAFAVREKTALVPGTPTTQRELISEIKQLAKELNVRQRLDAYGRTLQTLEDTPLKKAHYYLLKLEPKEQQVTLRGFRASELEEASKAYLEAEKSISANTGAEAVLVSVNSLASLRQAYPNYFLDTSLFLLSLEETLLRG